MSQQKPDDVIEVEIELDELDELDLTSAESSGGIFLKSKKGRPAGLPSGHRHRKFL